MIDDVEIMYCPKTKKRCYTSRSADEHLKWVRRIHHIKTRTGKIPKRKYYCNTCQMYHLTSQAHAMGTHKKKYIKTLYNCENYKTIRK